MSAFFLGARKDSQTANLCPTLEFCCLKKPQPNNGQRNQSKSYLNLFVENLFKAPYYKELTVFIELNLNEG